MNNETETKSCGKCGVALTKANTPAFGQGKRPDRTQLCNPCNIKESMAKFPGGKKGIVAVAVIAILALIGSLLPEEVNPEPITDNFNKGIAYPVKEWMDKNANDPASIEIIECSKVLAVEGSWIQRVKFRGKNKFGAMTINEMTFTIQNKKVVDYSGP